MISIGAFSYRLPRIARKSQPPQCRTGEPAPRLKAPLTKIPCHVFTCGFTLVISNAEDSALDGIAGIKERVNRIVPGISKGYRHAPITPEQNESPDPFHTTVLAVPRRKIDLSERELEVLRGVADGLSDKQVAGLLGISPKTVRNHISGIFSKLGAGNRVDAVLRAMRAGLLSI